MENLQLSLVLQTENKGSVVAGGELNVCLDGLVVDLGSLPNGSTATDSESRLTTHILTHTHTLTLTKKYTLFLMQTKCSHTHFHSFLHFLSLLVSGIYSHSLHLVTCLWLLIFVLFQTPPKRKVGLIWKKPKSFYFESVVVSNVME